MTTEEQDLSRAKWRLALNVIGAVGMFLIGLCMLRG